MRRIEDYTLFNHALNRFWERFPGKHLKNEFERAEPYGAQLGTNQYLLSPCEAVFVVTEGRCVTTVLTKEMAQANAHAFVQGMASAAVRDLFKQDEPKPPGQPRDSYTTEREVKDYEVKAIAVQHAQEDHASRHSRSKKVRHTLVREQISGFADRFVHEYTNAYCAERFRLSSKRLAS
jgi:hypothetical protein